MKLQHSGQDGTACGMICLQRALDADMLAEDDRRMSLVWASHPCAQFVHT